MTGGERVPLLAKLTLSALTVLELIPALSTREIMPVFCPTRVRFRCVGRVRAESREPKYAAHRRAAPG
jgi:hypothetical protein